jgi:hypothetical protein
MFRTGEWGQITGLNLPLESTHIILIWHYVTHSHVLLHHIFCINTEDFLESVISNITLAWMFHTLNTNL